MTREEAKSHIILKKQELERSRVAGLLTEDIEVFDVVIRNFDVWDVVKAEIDAYLIENEFGTAYRQEIADIIDKHLREVENGRSQEF